MGRVWVAERQAHRVPARKFRSSIHDVKQRADYTMIGTACPARDRVKKLYSPERVVHASTRIVEQNSARR
jgi:hypothetical protein